MNERRISHSEVSTLLTCQHRWDMSYGDQLAGSSLKPKAVSSTLRDGRACGAGIAAYDSGSSLDAAVVEMTDTLNQDAERLREFGVFDPVAYEESLALLTEILAHYAAENEPLGITRLEEEIIVPIPSRSGLRDSNRYRLQLFLDGVKDESDGPWLVENKLRGQLSSLLMISLSRQIRWYAWAYRKKYGVEPAGVIVNERLKAVPSEVKFNKNGSVSKVQSCTVDAYRAAGGDDEGVIEKLTAKNWLRRERVFLTTAEIDEAGQQLVSAGQQIRDFDTADRYPVRNPNPMFCGGCQFKEICPNPRDTELVNALFERTTPKKDRPTIREEVTA